MGSGLGGGVQCHPLQSLLLLWAGEPSTTSNRLSKRRSGRARGKATVCVVPKRLPNIRKEVSDRQIQLKDPPLPSERTKGQESLWLLEAPVRKMFLQMHTPVRTSQCWSRQTKHGLRVCIWMHLVNGTSNSLSLGQANIRMEVSDHQIQVKDTPSPQKGQKGKNHCAH